jgi:serine/threonine protein kinase
MADADWAQYKQIRGKPLPERVRFGNVLYRLAKVFKRDFYAATGLYRRTEGSSADAPEQIVFKHYHTDPLAIIPLRWLGRWLWRRETRLAERVEDVRGVAHVIGRHGKSGLIREYVAGVNLREHLRERRVDGRFFQELRRILGEIHALGVAHNDLNKPENILVRDDGSPVLIDFQIAYESGSRLPLVGHVERAIVRYLQRMDRYHILKHQRRHSPESLSAEDRVAAQHRGLLLNLHAWLLRRPYRAVRHLILRNFLMAGK